MRGPSPGGRYFAEGGDELLLGGGDEGRKVRRDTGLEQRLAGPAVSVGVGLEQVDSGESVYLEIDEARHGDAAPVR